MWVETEHGAAAQRVRSLLDRADVEVAVLDRGGKVALLERRPHRAVLRLRHATAEHERFRAPADGGPQGAHHHVAWPPPGEHHRPDLPDAGRAQPERMRVGLGDQRRHRPGEPDMAYMLFAR